MVHRMVQSGNNAEVLFRLPSAVKPGHIGQARVDYDAFSIGGLLDAGVRPRPPSPCRGEKGLGEAGVGGRPTSAPCSVWLACSTSSRAWCRRSSSRYMRTALRCDSLQTSGRSEPGELPPWAAYCCPLRRLTRFADWTVNAG